MVSVSLRQNRSSATDQNAPIPASITASAAVSTADSVRPVSGTPLWARNDHAPGTRRPTAPWEEWFIPPKPPELIELGEHAEQAEPAEIRKPRPHPTEPAAHATTSTHARPREQAVSGKHARLGDPTASGRHAAPIEPARHGKHAEQTEPAERSRTVAVAAVPASGAFAESSPPFRPWRIDFTRPDVIEYPAVPDAPAPGSPDSGTVAKRLLLLLGLAYLFIAALTSGLAYTGYLTTTPETNRTTNRTSKNSDISSTGGTGGTDDSADGAEPTEDTLPPRPPEPRPPSRHPNAPGLHTRPDGSRYLIMPLPADLADRFRGQAETTAHRNRAARPARPVRVVPVAAAMGGAL